MQREVYGRDIYYVISEQFYHLTSTDAKTVDVRSMDSQATSLHCMQIYDSAPNTTHVSVRSPDTDVLVLFLKNAMDFN